MKSGKGIDGIGPETTPEKAARRAVRRRLRVVGRLLPIAAQHASEDPVHVHQLRVATRRAMAALRVYAPLLPRKRSRAMLKDLQRIRETAGAARDLDVMLGRHEASPGAQGQRFLAELRKRRAEVQAPIEAESARHSERKRFRRRSAALVESVRFRDGKSRPARFDEWARSRLHGFAADFLAARPLGLDDLAALHRFRIRSKRLRYALELLAPAFPSEGFASLYAELRELQGRLGAINDHAVAASRLEHWLDEDRRGMSPEHLQVMLWDEQRQLDVALEAFRDWWSPERQECLASGIESLLKDPSHGEA